MKRAYGSLLALALLLLSLAALAIMPPSTMLHHGLADKAVNADKEQELEKGRKLLESLKTKVGELEQWFDKQREEHAVKAGNEQGSPLSKEKP